MNCAEVSSRLSAYHDGELESARRAAVAAHLAECPHCQAHLRDLARIGRLLRSEYPEVVPGGVWERLESAAVGVRVTGRGRRRVWISRLVGMAAGFALYMAGYRAFATTLQTRQRQSTIETRQVERVLRETQPVLASSGSVTKAQGMFERRPEARFLREMTKDLQP